MARIDSAEDILLIAIKFYEAEHGAGKHFGQWASSKIKNLIGMNYVEDASLRFGGPNGQLRVTSIGDEALQDLLYGDDTNPIHVPNYDQEGIRDELESRKSDALLGRKRFSLYSTSR